MLTRIARLSSIFFLFTVVAVPSFAQTCGQNRNCTNRQKEPERRVQPEQRRREPDAERRSRESEPEDRPEYNRRDASPENRSYNDARPESHPTVMTPAMNRAMTYNTRPGGIRINPQYFATHYGHANGFHFLRYAGGACIGDCGLRLVGNEWYFDFNGGWFGVIGQFPGNWALQTDYLYIDIGDDGNYYLYDAQFPGVAIQLTFVQNIGDDQAGVE